MTLYNVNLGLNLTPNSDCLWLNAPEPQHGVQGIQELLIDVIPRLGFDPARDVQVLCPMIRGEVGTRNLNAVLQEVLNPPRPDKAELIRGGMKLRVGDRVIQQVNDYTRFSISFFYTSLLVGVLRVFIQINVASTSVPELFPLP